jgi:hypothetical protein
LFIFISKAFVPDPKPGLFFIFLWSRIINPKLNFCLATNFSPQLIFLFFLLKPDFPPPFSNKHPNLKILLLALICLITKSKNYPIYFFITFSPILLILTSLYLTTTNILTILCHLLIAKSPNINNPTSLTNHFSSFSPFFTNL